MSEYSVLKTFLIKTATSRESTTIGANETRGSSSKSVLSKTGKLWGAFAGLKNLFVMGISTGSGSPRDYTVFGSLKNEEKGKNASRKWPKWTKVGKNGPKLEKSARETSENSFASSFGPQQISPSPMSCRRAITAPSFFGGFLTLIGLRVRRGFTQIDLASSAISSKRQLRNTSSGPSESKV
jgi:hypothetical protein